MRLFTKMASAAARFALFPQKEVCQIYPEFFLSNVLCLGMTPMIRTFSFLHHVFSVATRNSSTGKLVSTQEKRLGLPRGGMNSFPESFRHLVPTGIAK